MRHCICTHTALRIQIGLLRWSAKYHQFIFAYYFRNIFGLYAGPNLACGSLFLFQQKRKKNSTIFFQSFVIPNADSSNSQPQTTGLPLKKYDNIVNYTRNKKKYIYMIKLVNNIHQPAVLSRVSLFLFLDPSFRNYLLNSDSLLTLYSCEYIYFDSMLESVVPAFQ